MNINEFITLTIRNSAPFSGLKLFLSQILLGQSTDESGLASKIVLTKDQDRQTYRSNSTVYS
jgi:hypothetical protein